MAVKRVSPQEAHDLVTKEGYVYVDVRSIPEFDAGHPAGAYNVPLLHRGSFGPSPNPDFLAVIQKTFPPDTKIVLGCQSGVRSLQAASLLISVGYTNVVDQRAGYQGSSEPGWAPAGLPTSRQPDPGRSYDALRDKP